MEKEEFQKAVAERFDNLQPEVQSAIMSSDYEKNIYDISQKHKLNLEQMGTLEADTSLVMIGEIHPDKYTDELIKNLNLPKEKVFEIVADVNEKVLKPIREILKSNFERENTEEHESEEAPIPPYQKPEPNVPANLPIAEGATIMKDAGIEILKDKSVIEKPEASTMTIGEDKLLVKSGIKMVQDRPIIEKEHLIPTTETQKSLLRDIEQPANIIGAKLGGIVAKSAQTSDHTISKINPSSSLSNDSYREVI